MIEQGKVKFQNLLMKNSQLKMQFQKINYTKKSEIN